MMPAEMARTIGEGLLSFPVTHFDGRFQFEEDKYRQHIGWLLHHNPARLFAPIGQESLLLGEFPAIRSF